MNSYEEKTKRSKALFDKAKRVLPAGVSYAIRDVAPYPFYIKKAEGCKVIDVDGNVYTDFWMGHGALILGHSPKRVMDAAAGQIRRGTHFGFSHELEIELAKRIVDMVSSAEMVRYTNSGTEANMYASRLARAHTGRMKMAKVEGGWHGGYDSLHLGVHAPFDIPESAGLNPKVMEDTLVVPYNDVDATRKVLECGDVACIIVEPLMGAGGFIKPEPGYLEGLRDACDETGTLLVFDEVISGFRLDPGGGQGYFGVEPDITIIGKIMGGGFPIGAFCGPREIFDRLDHRKYPKMWERAFHGGTFVGNPVSMVAGIATLDILKEGKVYKHIDRLGEKVRGGLLDIIGRSKTEAAVTGICSTFGIHFQKEVPRNVRDVTKNKLEVAKAYYTHMLSRDIVYVSATLPHCFIGEPHTDDDVENFLATTEEFFRKYGD